MEPRTQVEAKDKYIHMTLRPNLGKLGDAWKNNSGWEHRLEGACKEAESDRIY